MKHLPLIALLALSLAPLAYAGRESHGSDNNVESLAWFYGRKEVVFCVEATPKFKAKVNEYRLADLVRETFRDWAHYVKRNHVDLHLPSYLRAAMAYPEDIKPAENGCKGAHDIAFYFGVRNAQIDEAKKRFDEPSAFTYLPDFKSSSTWQNGWVRIADPGEVTGTVDGVKVSLDWTDEEMLKLQLLHEWGHVFGNGHIAGTVMDASLHEQILRMIKEGHKAKAAINRTKELYYDPDRGEEYFVGGQHYDNDPNVSFGFRYFAGRPPVGQVRVALKLNRPDNRDGNNYLNFSDEGHGPEVFCPLQVLWGSPTVFTGEQLFRRRMTESVLQGRSIEIGEGRFKKSYSAGSVFSVPHFGVAYRAIMKCLLPQGGYGPLVYTAIERNMSPGPDSMPGAGDPFGDAYLPISVYGMISADSDRRVMLLNGESTAND